MCIQSVKVHAIVVCETYGYAVCCYFWMHRLLFITFVTGIGLVIRVASHKVFQL